MGGVRLPVADRSSVNRSHRRTSRATDARHGSTTERRRLSTKASVSKVESVKGGLRRVWGLPYGPRRRPRDAGEAGVGAYPSLFRRRGISRHTIPRPNSMEPIVVQTSPLRSPETVKNATPASHSPQPASSSRRFKESSSPHRARRGER